MQTWAQQANAQGITWFAASGDSGGADCYGGDSRATNDSLSVDLPAGIPEVTGVGGTEFSETSGSYWNATNDSDHSSALSYIPETSWNDSAVMDRTPPASGGGASIYFYQAVLANRTGVPADGARDVPDVALLLASAESRWTPGLLGRKQAQRCRRNLSPFPTCFAGIAALLNCIAGWLRGSPARHGLRYYPGSNAAPG